jgi:membrane protease YdiL (CAAX protease family)
VRNTAEYWLTNNVHLLLGSNALKVLNLLLIVFFVIALCRPREGNVFQFKVLGGMFGESMAYAVGLHLVITAVTVFVLQQNPPMFSVLETGQSYVLSIGAGVYEEVVFRLVLVTALLALLVHVSRWPVAYTLLFAGLTAVVLFTFLQFTFPLRAGIGSDSFMLRLSASALLGLVIALLVNLTGRPRPASAIVAILVAALAFTFAHHVGRLGEPIRPYTFLLRTVAGVVLGVIFAIRGLGIAVGTHALYNVMVLITAR